MRIIDADKLNIYDVSPADGFVVMGVTEEDIDLAPTIRTKEAKYFDEDEKVWKIGEVIVDECLSAEEIIDALDAVTWYNGLSE